MRYPNGVLIDVHSHYWRYPQDFTESFIAQARRALGDVRLTDRELNRIAGVCAHLDVEGLRADIVCAKTAKALAALDAASRAQYHAIFASLNPDQRQRLVRHMVDSTPPGWSGIIPAPLFYFALRSDAVDVVYGTVEGFRKLDIPYMPHILPARRW